MKFDNYMGKFASSGDVQTAIDNGDLVKPYVALVEDGNYIDWNTKSIDYSKMYFTIEALESGNLTVNAANYYYSINNGEWEVTVKPTTIGLSSGDKVRFKNSTNDSSTSMFTNNTLKFKVYGNIMSLRYGDNFVEQLNFNKWVNSMFYNCTGLIDAENLILKGNTITSDNVYKFMFNGCSSLTTAPELPATTLANSCYQNMFYNCSSLTTAPELPATTLGSNCYQYMFYGCSSLTTAPALPATTLADYCYYGMFQDCTGLTIAPALPATTLATNCYTSMFQGCTSLTTAPELPATTLANSCYYQMFQNCSSLTTVPSNYLPATTLARECYYNMFNGCSSLTTAPELPATTLTYECYYRMFSNCSITTAPELPATTLAEKCYAYMFGGCKKLNYIKCLATDISASNCMDYWVSGVASTGTFVKTAGVTWTTGASGIPNGWTVQEV